MQTSSEEAVGLRSFAVEVDAAGDAFATARPLRIRHRGRSIGVHAIIAQWREEERLGFRVRLVDGSAWLLYYVPELGIWSGVADEGAAVGSSLAE